jgi:hypothetical protein
MPNAVRNMVICTANGLQMQSRTRPAPPLYLPQFAASPICSFVDKRERTLQAHSHSIEHRNNGMRCINGIPMNGEIARVPAYWPAKYVLGTTRCGPVG